MTMPGRNPRPEFSPTMKWKYTNLSVLTLVLSLFAFALFVYNEDVMSIAGTAFPVSLSTTVVAPPESSKPLPSAKDEIEMPVFEDKRSKEEKGKEEEKVEVVPEACDLFAGKWVYDDVGHPLYREENCGFLTSQMTCVRNGRKDDMYQKWRWQPDGCSLPRFNATRLLRRLKGKRLMFVGDSLNRNQWESMVCLAQSVIPRGRKSLHVNGSLSIFRAEEYNATVEFFWAPFLVESNSDDAKAHSVLDRRIMADSLSRRGVHWVGVDYLVFNTYIWWMNTAKMKIMKGSMDYGSGAYDEIERAPAYERVLRTWGNWVDQNVDPNRTSVFFSTISPIHIKSDAWDNPHGIKCSKETKPILNRTQPLHVGTDKRLLDVVANVARAMAVPVSFLNITALSEYRKDAHTSLYTTRQGKVLSPEQRANPLMYADCIHWCLPGLPDTWNELLYAKIMSRPI